MDFIRVDETAFGRCPSESIDYAVMEQTRHAVVVPLEAGWNDIGSWSSVWEVGEKDEFGNVSMVTQSFKYVTLMFEETAVWWLRLECKIA